MRYPSLLTDLYELTMLAGYLEEGMAEKQAVFDLFFRTNPFEGGYAIFAGLEPALDYLEGLRFLPEELEFLHMACRCAEPMHIAGCRRSRMSWPPSGPMQTPFPTAPSCWWTPMTPLRAASPRPPFPERSMSSGHSGRMAA